MPIIARELVDEYVNWLKARIRLREMGGWTEIQTPYLDRHNDRLVIYAKENDGVITLTDDSHIIDDLAMSGCELTTSRRAELLQTILNGFGVHLDDRALTVQATRDDFPRRKHSLLQAMLAVDDLYVLASGQVQSIFLEDVAAWLDSQDVRYTPSVNFLGKSGFSHHFDFVVPKSKSQPERIIKAVTRPSREAAQGLVFAWQDTKVVRPSTAMPVALLNDEEHRVPPMVMEALGQYGIKSVLWSKRDESRELIAG